MKFYITMYCMYIMIIVASLKVMYGTAQMQCGDCSRESSSSG